LDNDTTCPQDHRYINNSPGSMVMLTYTGTWDPNCYLDLVITCSLGIGIAINGFKVPNGATIHVDVDSANMTMIDTFVPNRSAADCAAVLYNNQDMPYGQHTAAVHIVSNGSVSITSFT
jgi:hypothetical protein